ncbi:glycosyltransferase family 4 protein [Streptococcus equinus]|uniref:glycosyltransferase family 4 protein n=1 Tax=Streptococcus equinus TaxID=1335 RepID=UPI0012FBFF7C|nr:glycosyltransferase [Streptococcus equinus]QGX45344.1 glycosyltransferase [Streptococcus equinus]
MKILIFRTCSTNININNYNIQEIGLAKALVDSGNTCDIIFYTSKEERVERISYKDKEIKIYWIKGLNFLHNGIYNFDKILKITNNYDVIQCSDYNQIATYVMLKKSLKPVVIYHGPYNNKFRWKTNMVDCLFDTIFLKKMLKLNPLIICKSKLAKDSLKDKGFKNLTCIPVGLDISRFEKKQSDKLNSNSNNQILLYIGQIAKRRSIDFLLDLEKEYKKKNPNSKLVMIGNGKRSFCKHVEKRIQNEALSGNVEWIRKLPQEELCKYYNSATAFLLPSKYEIFGMVLLEANYFNLPILSTLNGGSSSIIQNSSDGYIIDNFNIDEWISKLDLVSSNGCSKSEFKNTWNDRVGEFLNIYKRGIEKE